MIGRGLRCWLLMYEKSLPLDLNACNKCHYSRFFPHSLSFFLLMLLMHRWWRGRRIRWKSPVCSQLLLAPRATQPRNHRCCKKHVKAPSFDTNSLLLFFNHRFRNLRCCALYLMTPGSRAPRGAKEGIYQSRLLVFLKLNKKRPMKRQTSPLLTKGFSYSLDPDSGFSLYLLF